MAWRSFDGEFPAYVSAAERRRAAARELLRLRKQGRAPEPVELAPRAPIAATFWGRSWCEHLESYADYASRLPRGRSYLRCGAVVDLRIAPGAIRAVVVGSDVYQARVDVAPLAAERWSVVRAECAGRVGSLVELLSGKLSTAVMEVLCDRERGIFPAPSEIELACSCPDGARLCKHLAAVLYGVGARLDCAPELLFTLRGVDGAELVAGAGDAGALVARGAAAAAPLDERALAELFGIELEPARDPLTPLRRGRSPPAPRRRGGGRRPRRRASGRRSAAPGTRGARAGG
jgi:uncharacterized Zn finger protein